jgi:hypothetical protein
VVYCIISFPAPLLIRLIILFGVDSVLGYGITRRSSNRYNNYSAETGQWKRDHVTSRGRAFCGTVRVALINPGEE